MLLFCPSCANVLTVSTTKVPSPTQGNNVLEDTNRFECRTCPYEYILTKRWFERKTFERKVQEKVFGGDNAEAGQQQTATKQCNSAACDGREASYYEVQIRSADEPMTLFYTCLTCKAQWRE
ncbi:DNA-directed RNA polymeras-like protein III subunit rpc10 [Calycina marina]|uniref:DNA-directed RNA polymerase subunit n=1 Tax=Calycina marina TaxID=1763456 RepID=A0A9P7Z1W3_9HELO|nr:DNA-directed RNA polymeras-like protein III subunit rpc10 [Calycina marina]